MEQANTKTKTNTSFKNHYGLSEWAGAFGDLGTLIPFVIGYISIAGLDPLGILVMFGIFLILSGLYYKTPMPVQPMKAIGAAAIASATTVTSGMIWGSGIFTGLFWLIVGLTGKLNYISKLAAKPVIKGIMLGLGLSFVINGINMIKTDLLVGISALTATFILLSRKRVPVMFILIVIGIAAGLLRNPELVKELSSIHFEIMLPHFSLGKLTYADFIKSIFVLAIPQIPLTFGNAVIAVTQKNNDLFPEHPVNENQIAVSQGIINLIAPIFGGIPMCHGAGGMAGHVRFGARTGGATVLLGCILLFLGVCFSNSVLVLFSMFSTSVLGVMLFFAGLELAIFAADIGSNRNDFYVLLITAGFSLWNIGIGFLVGLTVQKLIMKKIIRL